MEVSLTDPQQLTAEAVASKFMKKPLDQITISKDTLKGGASNNGIFLYTARALDNSVFKFVEKRPKGRRELEFLQKFHLEIEASQGLCVPDVFAAGTLEDGDVIFMEHIENVLKNPSEIKEVTPELGEAISEISKLNSSETLDAPLIDHLRPSLIEKLTETVEKTSEDGQKDRHISVLHELKRASESLRNHFEALPKCPVHGDIFFENIGYIPQPGREDKKIIFLDWGDYRIDRVGADLHHFCGQGSIGDLMESSFFNNILRAYRKSLIEHFGEIEEERIMLAALIRRFSRKSMNAVNGDKKALTPAMRAASILVDYNYQ